MNEGVYEGTARLINNASEFGRLQQGDVLVTRSTAPYFNVVLPLLGALVTDRGGQLCHAAIVAREYGIPGVVGTKEATKLIADGYFIRSVTDELVTQPFTPGTGFLGDRLDPKFVAATLSSPEFLKSWSGSFTPDDFAPKALLNLQSIWKSSHADWNEFLSLALALALVKDQQPPGFWPHSQVAQADVPRLDLPPATLFSQWV